MKKRFIIICSLLLSVLVLVIIIFKIWVNYNKNLQQIPVLMYHNVVEDENYIGQADTITLSTFEKHLQYFQENDIEVLSLDEFYCWKNNDCQIKDQAVVLTFDDGFYSFHYLVEPLLEKYNVTAINFLVGNTIEDKTKDYVPMKYGTIGKDFINEHSSYVEYGSHSFAMHEFVDGKQKIYLLNNKELQEDINYMKQIADFKYYSYPYNTDTDEYIEILKNNGYKLAFRGENEKVTKGAHNYQIPRIGVREDMEHLKLIFETDEYNNRYGNGFLRKVFVTIERKLNIRIG